LDFRSAGKTQIGHRASVEAMIGHAQFSPTALLCLDRQLAEALDLAVSCHQLSDQARSDGELLTVVVLERLASDLTDLAGFLIPLVGAGNGATTPPLAEGASSRAETWLAELDNRLGQAEMAAEVDALSPGLELSVVQLLSKLAAVYQSSRELLLVAAAADAA
jgi:hypothetical protein